MSERPGRVPADPFGLLGIARRAGELEMGFDAAMRSLTRGEARLLVLARDVGESTAGKVRRAAGPVPVIVLGEKESLGKALGRGETGVVAVTDGGFSRALMSRSNEEVMSSVNAGKDAGV